MTAVDPGRLVCPTPFQVHDRVQLGHGSGGRLSGDLIRDCFLPHLGNPELARLADGAVVPVTAGDLVVSTDTFVVQPLEFPGGNIGSLAVHGTLNDVAMMGGTPECLTAGFVLEEGLPMATLDRIVRAMAEAAGAAGVPIVTGDTKVVERGQADGLYLNTTGIGRRDDAMRPAPDRARPRDVIVVSAPIARHGMAIMAARQDLGFAATIESDSACLVPLVNVLRMRVGDDVHVLRDPTRGGLASALNEIAVASNVGMELAEGAIQVPGPVAAACEMLGLDPLYVANEGVLVAIVAERQAAAVLEALHSHPLGREAAIIGRVVEAHPRLVVLRTALGGNRIVDLLPGDQLPRIC